MGRSMIFAWLLLASLVTAQARININTDAVKKAVVFLYAAKESGEVDPDKPVGTGFLVEVPLQSSPLRAYKLLVTARDIVEPQWALCQAPNPRLIYARLNKKDYSPTKDAEGVGYVQLTVTQDGRSLWVVHDDPQVDVAVTLLVPQNFEAYDLSAVPVSLLATSAELHGITEGDLVVSAGLIPSASAQQTHAHHLEHWALGGPTQPRKLWLVAANLVPGNSGSPVFEVPAGAGGIVLGGGRAILLGLQSMSFLLADVAGMTSAQYIFDVVQKLNLKDADLYRGAPENKPK